VPDPFHYAIVRTALDHNQHVLCVKPLVLKYDHAHEIGLLAREKDCSWRRIPQTVRPPLAHGPAAVCAGALRRIRDGRGADDRALLLRHSNFQNWFTCDQTDPFVYVGCHYVDLVSFITGLRPVAVSVSGVKGRFPNGQEGYLWANGRVCFAKRRLADCH